MKRKTNMILILLVMLSLGFMGLVNAQRIVHIAPTAFGIVNTTIDGDTLANGDRVDLNTIYELERGLLSYYIFNGTIKNDYPLHIRATGEGPRPKLIPGVIEGGVSNRLFEPSADLTLEGLYMTGQDNSNVMFSSQIIRVAAEGIRITVDDCHFHGDRQCFMQLNSQMSRVFVTNSLLGFSINNGRGIDRRGNRMDSLLIQNCTIYNMISRPVREGGTGYSNYIKIDHVTYYNLGEEVSQLGETVDVTFTNNLIVNPGFLGVVDDGSPDAYFNTLRPLSSPDLVGKTQKVDIGHNNLWLDPEIVNIFATLNLNPAVFGDTTKIVQRILADETADSLIPAGAFINEAMEFPGGPAVDSLYWVIRNTWEVLDGAEEFATGFNNGPEGVDVFADPLYGIYPFNLAYSTSKQSYTAGENGLPLGDLNWFPDKKEIWLTDIEDNQLSGSPFEFRLSQNYPNPFNPSTNIQYSIPEPGLVNIKVFDVLGRQVTQLVNKKQSAGTYTVNFDAQNLSAGVYIYKIESGSFQASKKMILMK